jgi:integrase
MSKRDHGDGGIDERGPNRYRLRWRVDGKRFSKSFHGSISEARKELRRLIKSADDGVHIAPAKLTIAQYLREWLNTEPVIGAKGKILSPKTLERYRQLRDEQIIPHLGSTLLQSLKPVQVHGWHSTLLGSGGTSGRPLAPRTVGHAHRLLHGGLERAVKLELVTRNVVHAVHPPEVDDDDEVVILTEEQIADVLNREEHPLHAIVALALGSGMRRGELCALPWSCLDLNKAQVRVERSLVSESESYKLYYALQNCDA